MPRVAIFDEAGGPDVLQIVEEPVREPAAGEVRIAIEGFAVNRLDQMMRAGFSPRPIRLPHARLGIEATGRINAVGDEVADLAVGDAVIITAVPDMDTNGTYAEQVVVPANRGAADHVLITAASSGVGLAAIQVANQIGAVPIAVTRHASKREALLAAGAATVIATDESDIVDATRAATHGVGADIIIDSVMGPGLADLAKAARFSGTLVTVGWLDPRPPSFPMGPLTIHRYMSFEHTLDDTVVRRIAAYLGAGIRTGVLKPIVDRVFRFEDIVDAHRYLENGQQLGKVVVTV